MRWHVQVMGEGPVLLLLHGTGAATHSWRDLMPLLAAHFTVSRPICPGTASPPAAGRRPVDAGDGASGRRIAGRARRSTPALIVGHSAGAAIALRMALDAPWRRRARWSGSTPRCCRFPDLPRGCSRRWRGCCSSIRSRRMIFSRHRPHTGRGRRASCRAAPDRGSMRRGSDFYGRLFATPAQCAGAITMMADWDLDTLKRDLPRVRHAGCCSSHGDRDAAIPLGNAARGGGAGPRRAGRDGGGAGPSGARGAAGADCRPHRRLRTDDRLDKEERMDHRYFSLFDMAIVGVPVHRLSASGS